MVNERLPLFSAISSQSTIGISLADVGSKGALFCRWAPNPGTNCLAHPSALRLSARPRRGKAGILKKPLRSLGHVAVSQYFVAEPVCAKAIDDSRNTRAAALNSIV